MPGKVASFSFKILLIWNHLQAVLVKLAHIEPVDKTTGWNDVATEFLQSYMKDKPSFKVVVSEQTDKLSVVLFECFLEIDFCINAALVESGLALSTGKL